MIESYIKDIRKSLENECYFSALSLALVLPDICGSIEYPDKQVYERYIEWSDNYLIPRMYNKGDQNGISGETLYNLRNRYLHQGSAQVDNKKLKNKDNRIDKIILVTGKNPKISETIITLKNSDYGVLHRLEVIHLNYLCEMICEVVEEYMNENSKQYSSDIIIIDDNTPIIDSKCDKEHLNNLSQEDFNKRLLNDKQFISILNQYIENVHIENEQQIIEDYRKKEKVKKEEKIKKTQNNTKSKKVEKNGKNAKSKKVAKTVKNKKTEEDIEKKESVGFYNIEKYVYLHFNQPKYANYIDEIINAVQVSKTKNQLKKKLNVICSNDTDIIDVIFRKLTPLIKKLPEG